MKKYIVGFMVLVLSLFAVGFADSATFGVEYNPGFVATAEYGVAVDGGEILFGAVYDWTSGDADVTVGLASPLADSVIGGFDFVLRLVVPVFNGGEFGLGQVSGQTGVQWELPFLPVAVEGGVQAPFNGDLLNSWDWYARAGLSFEF